ncbi:hypothetical protein FB45DRAFT_877884 [Roridomyces roridus]|uniref:Uncharacterized protein n=1 Tax=Roridomyces roridus TaxID=1738132 RepID=A0AAD7F9U6_9AGAR|nr:hypothetical protein FB45DRAFT_877884 [Roridomyces roridus]
MPAERTLRARPSRLAPPLPMDLVSYMNRRLGIYPDGAHLFDIGADKPSGNKRVPNQACKRVVEALGFARYQEVHDKAFKFRPTIKLCKGCFVFAPSNPSRRDADAPECTCPAGAKACQEDLTGCELHKVPAFTEVSRVDLPLYRKLGHRITEQILKERVDKLNKKLANSGFEMGEPAYTLLAKAVARAEDEQLLFHRLPASQFTLSTTTETRTNNRPRWACLLSVLGQEQWLGRLAFWRTNNWGRVRFRLSFLEPERTIGNLADGLYKPSLRFTPMATPTFPTDRSAFSPGTQLFDIGATKPSGNPLIPASAILLTRPQLAFHALEHRYYNKPCEKCIAPLAFGNYEPNDSDPGQLIPTTDCCKDCYKFCFTNPAMNTVDDPFECTCPPEAIAGQKGQTGCMHHRSSAYAMVPQHVTSIKRPLYEVDTSKILRTRVEELEIKLENVPFGTPAYDSIWDALQCAYDDRWEFDLVPYHNYKLPAKPVPRSVQEPNPPFRTAANQQDPEYRFLRWHEA